MESTEASDHDKLDFKFEAEGKRSGVRSELSKLPKPGEFESLGKLFDGARSPDPADVAAGEISVDIEDNVGDSGSDSRAKPIPLKEPRLSLPGASKSKSNEPIKESKAYAKARMHKITISPSDMSMVSTAPPTPQPPVASHQETPFVSQGNAIRTSNDQEESLSVKQTRHAQNSDSASQPVALNADPPSDDEDEEEDDELVPPPPAPKDIPEESSQKHNDTEEFAPPEDHFDDGGDQDEGSFTMPQEDDHSEDGDNSNQKTHDKEGEKEDAARTKAPTNSVPPTPASGDKSEKTA